MIFKCIEHFEYIDELTVFSVGISDMPQYIQDEAKKIDGEAYNADCFGMCIDYDITKKEYSIDTERGSPTDDECNTYYIDVNGDKHWFRVDVMEDFINSVFKACDKVNAGKKAPLGYEVVKYVLFENNEGILLGKKKDAENPFVVWNFKLDEYGRRHCGLNKKTTVEKHMAEVEFEELVAQYQRYYDAPIKMEEVLPDDGIVEMS